MARVTIVIEDKPDGSTQIVTEFDPKLPKDAENRTQAQSLALMFLNIPASIKGTQVFSDGDGHGH